MSPEDDDQDLAASLEAAYERLSPKQQATFRAVVNVFQDPAAPDWMKAHLRQLIDRYHGHIYS